MRRADEAVDGHSTQLPDLRRLQDVRDGCGREHMAAQHAEIGHRPLARLAQHQGGGRRSGFKANGQEYDLALGVLVGQGQGVGRRIDHAHIGPARLGLDERKPFRRGHAHGVAVGAQHHTALQRQADRQVDAADGQHAHRAAGAVDHAHAVRQKTLDAIALHRMGMPATEFHETVVTPGPYLGSDAGCDVARQFTIAVLGYVLHAPPCVLASSANSARVRSASSGSILPMA